MIIPCLLDGGVLDPTLLSSPTYGQIQSTIFTTFFITENNIDQKERQKKSKKNKIKENYKN